jgi:hypothetical protein
MPHPYLDLPGLPFDTADDSRDQPRGLTAREALVLLLNNQDALTDETWNFVRSCAKFPRLSSKQQEALVSTWYQVELAIAFEKAEAERNRSKRRKKSSGESDR